MTRCLLPFWCALAVFLALATVRAQAPPAEGKESEEQTVAKCLAELASDDVQARRRAILVLGKYDHPRALAGLLRALEDADAQVRQSALVSFSERPDLPAVAVQPILGRMADPNVHVRRIASSMLPDVLLREHLREPLPRLRPEGARAAGTDSVAEAMDRALEDEDPTVLRNVLQVAAQFAMPLSPDKVLSCLGHGDRDVRVLALQALRRLPHRNDRELAARLAPLARDQDSTIRREAASALARSGAAGLPDLRMLAADKVPEVRLEASRQLVLLQDEGAPALLVALLRDQEIDPEERASLVHHLLLFQGPGLELLSELAAAGPTALRAAAIQAMGDRAFADRAPAPAFFLGLLEDPQLPVRQASARALQVLFPKLAPEQIRRMLESRYPDVRRAALGRARGLPPEQAAEFLVDACLDDDAEVRSVALMQLAVLRLPGWEEILVQSLRDPDPAIRQTAVNALCLVRSDAAIVHLKAFLETCDDPLLAQRIRAALRRPDPRPPVLLPPQRSGSPAIAPKNR